VDDQKTSIVVESADPPQQPIGQDEPYAMIVADLSGIRGEDAQPDWKAHEVGAANYDHFIANTARPRFRAEVDDHLTGKAGSKLAVDITFTSTTPNWPQQLDAIPELASVVQLIRQVEHLKRHLSQQVAVRNRLESLLGTAIGNASDN
jgi:type VI secretion system ImpB/VipA family protein